MKQIPGYVNYSATVDGRIWSSKTKRFLRPELSRGYKFVNLRNNGNTRHAAVHSLILETFVGPRPKGNDACHANGCRSDNRLVNLRWDTHSANMIDAVRHGTWRNGGCRGETHGGSRLTETDVRTIIYTWKTGLFLQREIAAIYGVATITIKSIVNGRSWRHIWK